MKYGVSIVAACVAACGVQCLAQPTVSRVPTQNTSATVTFVSAGLWDVTCTTSHAAAPTTFTVIGGSTADNIRILRVNVNTPQIVNLKVRGPTSNSSIATVSTILRSGSGTGTLVLEELRTSGNVGSISVNTINGSNIGGNLTGSITCLERILGGNASLILMTIVGDLLGDVDVTHGELIRLTIDGKIGTSATNRVSIDSLKIANIIADEINADITAISTGTQGRVRRIETRTGGDFNGSLSLREFHSDSGTGAPGLFVLGDLNADVTFTKQVNGIGQISITGELAAGKTIEIESHLTGPVSIGSGGLKGQIIVNSGDLGSSWTGNVTVGTTTLSPKPAYTQTGLGGGAVGEVAFDCHLQDCDPPYIGANEPTVGEGHASIVLDEVTLRHYGPVTWGSGAMPIKVTVCITGTECDQHTDVTSDWTVINSPGGRDVVAKYDGGGVPDTGHDHFTPVLTGANKLECTGITASGVVVAGWEYTLQYDG